MVDLITPRNDTLLPWAPESCRLSQGVLVQERFLLTKPATPKTSLYVRYGTRFGCTESASKIVLRSVVSVKRGAGHSNVQGVAPASATP